MYLLFCFDPTYDWVEHKGVTPWKKLHTNWDRSLSLKLSV